MSLSVTFRHALPGMAFDVAFEAPGGVTALFGRSGSGKTTVVNAVGVAMTALLLSEWLARRIAAQIAAR